MTDEACPVRSAKGHKRNSEISNKVYLVGAGPGSSDLITVRGKNALKAADVIIYDYLVDRRLLDQAKEGAELICCGKLGKKRCSDGFSASQDKINKLIIKKAVEGKKVVRLKNGDPSIFGRSSREMEALAEKKIEFELVPGVTAASSASCLSGIPLTDRRFASSCVFVTGHEDPKKKKSLIDWDSLSKTGTIVLYMAVANIGKIACYLLKSGKDKNTPAAIIQNAGLPVQKLITGKLKNIESKASKHKIKAPAIVIIGEVVKLEKRFNWLRKNRRVFFTGLSEDRFFIKGTYFHLPLIAIKPIEDYTEFDNYLRDIRNYDWIVFASRYGVEYFFKRLRAVKLDSRSLDKIKIAAVGGSTMNRLLDFGIVADLTPKDESSRGLAKALGASGMKNKKIFLPRSNLADKGLGRKLTRLGAVVASSCAYKNVMPDNLPDLDLCSFDEIMFTSPSTVRNFKRRYRQVPKGITVRCIGDVTLKEAKRCRLSG